MHYIEGNYRFLRIGDKLLFIDFLKNYSREIKKDGSNGQKRGEDFAPIM